MNSNDIENRLLRCFQGVFATLSEEEIRQSRQGSTEAWDSLASIMLAQTIGEEFGIEVDLFSLDQLASFDAARAYVAERVSA